MTQQCACNRKALLLASRNLYTPFTDQRIQAALGSCQQTVSGCLLQHFHTFLISCVGVYKYEVLANRAREELCVLRDKSDFFPKQIEIYPVRWDSVVKNLA